MPEPYEGLPLVKAFGLACGVISAALQIASLALHGSMFALVETYNDPQNASRCISQRVDYNFFRACSLGICVSHDQYILKGQSFLGSDWLDHSKSLAIAACVILCALCLLFPLSFKDDLAKAVTRSTAFLGWLPLIFQIAEIGLLGTNTDVVKEDYGGNFFFLFGFDFAVAAVFLTLLYACAMTYICIVNECAERRGYAKIPDESVN